MSMEPIRLQKILSQAGIGSRRYCEIIMERGKVSVNGQTVTELGSRALWSDDIRVNGVLIVSKPETLTYVFNKPRGVVSTMHDDQGRPCLSDYLPNEDVRLFHVGRLDEQTEGLIILTNDGDLAQRLAHPKYEIGKTYLATVDGEISRLTVRNLLSGIELEDGPIKCDSVVVKQFSVDQSIVSVILHSGRNRIVRRTLAAVGHPVRRLVRTHIGTLGIDGLKPGEMRELNFKDLKALSVNAKW